METIFTPRYKINQLAKKKKKTKKTTFLWSYKPHDLSFLLFTATLCERKFEKSLQLKKESFHNQYSKKEILQLFPDLLPLLEHNLAWNSMKYVPVIDIIFYTFFIYF